MPRNSRNQSNQPQRSFIERIKEFSGLSWSKIFGWLLTLIPASFTLGFAIGVFVTNIQRNHEIVILSIQHNKELLEEANKVKAEDNEAIKKQSERIELLLKIAEKGGKK